METIGTEKKTAEDGLADASIMQRHVRESTQAQEYQGLCTLCAQSESCTFPRSPERAVRECEEFEGMTMEPAEKFIRDRQRDFKKEAMQGDQSTSSLKGLCKTCASNTQCTFPRPEGGIWHCEEFI